RYAAQPLLYVDGDVIRARGRTQNIGREDRVGKPGAHGLDPRITGIAEVKRQLVGEDRSAVLLRMGVRLACPRTSDLIAQLLGLEPLQIALNVCEKARRRDAGRDDA